MDFQTAMHQVERMKGFLQQHMDAFTMLEETLQAALRVPLVLEAAEKDKERVSQETEAMKGKLAEANVAFNHAYKELERSFATAQVATDDKKAELAKALDKTRATISQEIANLDTHLATKKEEVAKEMTSLAAKLAEMDAERQEYSRIVANAKKEAEVATVALAKANAEYEKFKRVVLGG